MRIDRDQLVRLGTFWLRPDFVLRVVARFQKIAGFDRAIALASGAFTATIPLSIFLAAILPHGEQSADRIVARYDLTGDGAEAVRDAFSGADDVETSVGLIGVFLLVVTVLSFTRGVQRLFEQTWELPPLSVRNSLNGAKWITAFAVYLTLTGTIAAATDRNFVELLARILAAPFLAAFMVWSGYVLSSKRIPWRDLVPFGVIAAALLSVYQIVMSVYAPHAFNTYAARYGVIGVVLAMISSLFGYMVVLVGSAALGREVRQELDNIRDGIRPSEDELRKQWDIVMTAARERRADAEAWITRLRSRGTSEAPPAPPPDAARRDEADQV